MIVNHVISFLIILIKEKLKLSAYNLFKTPKPPINFTKRTKNFITRKDHTIYGNKKSIKLNNYKFKGRNFTNLWFQKNQINNLWSRIRLQCQEHFPIFHQGCTELNKLDPWASIRWPTRIRLDAFLLAGASQHNRCHPYY